MVFQLLLFLKMNPSRQGQASAQPRPLLSPQRTSRFSLAFQSPVQGFPFLLKTRRGIHGQRPGVGWPVDRAEHSGQSQRRSLWGRGPVMGALWASTISALGAKVTTQKLSANRTPSEPSENGNLAWEIEGHVEFTFLLSLFATDIT